MKKSISLLLAAVLALSLAACGSTETVSETADNTDSGSQITQEETGGQPDTADTDSGETSGQEKEAPELAEMVAAGTLPSLEERLPVASDVMVEPDIMALGQYGGSFVTTTTDNGRWNWGPITEQSMFRFKQDGSGEVEANVCKEFSSNADGTVWTIKLREGMKWSDGQPFTADDIIFYYDHMSTPALNEDRTAVDAEAENYYNAYTTKPYACYQVEKDGKLYWAVFDKVNDYELTVTFAAPKPSFPADVAVDNKWMFLPKHFYINYVARKDGVTDDTSFPLLTEEEALANANADFGRQWDAYGTMARDIGYYHWDYHIVPQLRSFIATADNWNVVGETYELVRNPYFWKTDSEGRQLPYLDSIQVKIINEQDQIDLQAMAGEFDAYEVKYNYATVVSATQATHTIRPWVAPTWSTNENLQLNQTVKDLDKRALFQDIRFRQALSICVDRNLLNATLQNGMSQPGQAAVPEGMIGYNAEWTNKWTEYDVDAANALMDEMTEPWDGSEGTYRLMKGTDKEVEIILSIVEPSQYGDFVSMIQSAYAEIGVKLSVKVDPEYRTAMLTNDVEACCEFTSVSTPALRPDSIIPMANKAVWHSAYGKWYEDGKSTVNGGVEPTGAVLELLNAYETMKAASGADREQVIQEQVDRIYQLHAENIWLIGYLSGLPNYLLINNNLQNFPEGLMWVDEFRFYALARPEQFWRSDL